MWPSLPFIDQGGSTLQRGASSHVSLPIPLLCASAAPRRFARLPRVSACGRKSSRHPPPPNRTSTGMCQRERTRDFSAEADTRVHSTPRGLLSFVFHFEQVYPVHKNHRLHSDRHIRCPRFPPRLVLPNAVSDPFSASHILRIRLFRVAHLVVPTLLAPRLPSVGFPPYVGVVLRMRARASVL